MFREKQIAKGSFHPPFCYRNLAVADPMSADAPEALPGAQHADNV